MQKQKYVQSSVLAVRGYASADKIFAGLNISRHRTFKRQTTILLHMFVVFPLQQVIAS